MIKDRSDIAESLRMAVMHELEKATQGLVEKAHGELEDKYRQLISDMALSIAGNYMVEHRGDEMVIRFKLSDSKKREFRGSY